MNNNIIAKKLKEIRKRHNISQYKLALETDVNRSNISRIEKGEHLPSTQTLERLANYFNVSVDYFYDNEQDIKYSLEVSGYATAGNLSNIDQPYFIGHIEVPKKFSNSKRFMAVRVVGESMNKIIINNSVAIFDKQLEHYNNKIVLIRLNHEFTIKKYHDKKDVIMLEPISYDKEYKIFAINKKDIYDIQIFGVLVWSCSEH